MKKVFAIVFSACFLLLLCSCGVDPLTVEIACTGETDEYGDTYFSIQTNLPDDTSLIVTVNGIDNGDNFQNVHYTAQDDVVVMQGSAVAGPFRNGTAPLIMGEYAVNVTMPYAGTQSETVQEMIGKKGQGLRGDFVVESENDGKYVSYDSNWTMENMSEELTERERVLLNGGRDAALLYRELSAGDPQVEVHYTEFNFTRAIIDNLSELNDLNMAVIDYSATTYDSVADSTHALEANDAVLSLKVLKGFPSGIILEDGLDSLGMESLYGDLAVQMGIAYEYTDEELQNVNLALNQLIGWLELELPTEEDYNNFDALLN